jgi:O-antigen/teichoic acid export membrane protein
VILHNKKTKYIPVVNLVPAFANIGLNLIFIPLFGIYGAVLTTLFCGFLTLVLAHLFAYRCEGTTFGYAKIGGLVTAVFLLSYVNIYLFECMILPRIGLKLLFLAVYMGLAMLIFKINISKMREIVFGGQDRE